METQQPSYLAKLIEDLHGSLRSVTKLLLAEPVYHSEVVQSSLRYDAKTWNGLKEFIVTLSNLINFRTHLKPYLHKLNVSACILLGH